MLPRYFCDCRGGGYPPVQGAGYPPVPGAGYPPAQGGGYPPVYGGGHPPQGRKWAHRQHQPLTHPTTFYQSQTPKVCDSGKLVNRYFYP